MNAKPISMTLLSFALAGCAHSLPPLKVEPVQPLHPQLTPPPPELMQMDCVFLRPPMCVKRAPKSN